MEYKHAQESRSVSLACICFIVTGFMEGSAATNTRLRVRQQNAFPVFPREFNTD